VEKSFNISFNNLQSKTHSYESLTEHVYPTEKVNVFEITINMIKLPKNEVIIFYKNKIIFLSLSCLY